MANQWHFPDGDIGSAVETLKNSKLLWLFYESLFMILLASPSSISLCLAIGWLLPDWGFLYQSWLPPWRTKTHPSDLIIRRSSFLFKLQLPLAEKVQRQVPNLRRYLYKSLSGSFSTHPKFYPDSHSQGIPGYIRCTSLVSFDIEHWIPHFSPSLRSFIRKAWFHQPL